MTWVEISQEEALAAYRRHMDARFHGAVSAELDPAPAVPMRHLLGWLIRQRLSRMTRIPPKPLALLLLAGYLSFLEYLLIRALR